MWYLWQLEWLKWRKHLTFRVMIIAYLIILPAVYLTAKEIPELPPPIGSPEVLFIFPTIWPYLAFAGTWVVFFLFGLLGIILVTSEYNFKTLRQNIITGLSRPQYFWAKVLFFISLSLFTTLYYFLCGLVIGWWHTEVIISAKVFQYSDYFLRYFLLTMGYLSLGMLFGVLIKRTGLAIILYFGYIMFVEVAWRWLVHFQLFNHKSMHFYPAKAISDIAPFPVFEPAQEFLEQNEFPLFLSDVEAIVTLSIYILLFLGLSYRRINYSDL